MTNSHPKKPADCTNSHDPMRRMMLGAMAGTFALSAFARTGSASAMAQEKEEVFNANNRVKAFTGKEMDSGTPWVAPKFGNFDLKNPIDNRLAVLKMCHNLVGKRTYVPMLTRQLIAREDLPGGLLVGAASMFTWQLQEPDPAEFTDIPKGTVLFRSMYTSVSLDPHTMEMVETLKNPYNGKMMKLEDSSNIFIENFLLFPKGGTRFVEERQFADDDPEKPKLNLIKEWGDELMLFNGGVYSKPGKHQPRFTENTWRSPTKDVMDPNARLIDTTYNFLGVNKAFEKPWAGYTEDHKDSLMSLASGKKVHSVDDLPNIIKNTILKKYPDRI